MRPVSRVATHWIWPPKVKRWPYTAAAPVGVPAMAEGCTVAAEEEEQEEWQGGGALSLARLLTSASTIPRFKSSRAREALSEHD